MSGNFFRGTTAEQDTRFSNKEAKLLKSHKHFAPDLDKPVDISKVNMEVMMKWIVKRVTELLGMEDDVLCGFIDGLLQDKGLNGKKMQLQLTGFMEKNTGRFMKELWELLMSAQANPSGIPQQFLDEKAAELRAKKAEEERIKDEVQKQREAQDRERERQREERQKLRDERHAADTAQQDQRPKRPPTPDTKRLSPAAANGGRAASPEPNGSPPYRAPLPGSRSSSSASPPPRAAQRRLPSPPPLRPPRSPPRGYRRSPPPRRRTPPRYYRSPGRSRRSPSPEDDRRRDGRHWRGGVSGPGGRSRYDRSRSPADRRLRRDRSPSPNRRPAPASAREHRGPALPPPPPMRSPLSDHSDRSSPEGSPPRRIQRQGHRGSRSPLARARGRSPLPLSPRDLHPPPPAEGGRGDLSRSPPARREQEKGGKDYDRKVGREGRAHSAESDSDGMGPEKKRKGVYDLGASPADSEERREAKRRRKEEKRKRKEERQKKREEKQKRRAEREARRAAREAEGGHGEEGSESDGGEGDKGEERQKQVEEELRLKALESMRARAARNGPV